MTEPHVAKLTREQFEDFCKYGEITVKCDNAPGYCTIRVTVEESEDK